MAALGYHLIRGFVLLIPVVAVGAAGAWAFNPDSGAVQHSEVLWRVFGIMAEVGGLLAAIALILAGVCALLSLGPQRRQRL